MRRFVLDALPADQCSGTLVGRVWLPGAQGGPAVVVFREDGVWNLSPRFPVMSELLNHEGSLSQIRNMSGLERIGSLQDLLNNTPPEVRDPDQPWLLAPCDLQALKACGVTFVASMLERVIEEQARGDFTKANALREQITTLIGDNLSEVQPGSDAAMQVKAVLLEQGAWSPYLEVGIGKDAQIFTKNQPMSAVGTGVEIGIRPESSWNNPEPEIVLAVNAAGSVVGAALGNDVNLRDFEGRSALLLGKAKDNNASCAIGPWLRLFDKSFSLDDCRNAEIRITVDGPEGYRLEGRSSMSEISRDPEDLVRHAMGDHHQYPDGMMLFLGTMFAPTEDRDVPGQGFTHKVGDLVRISTPKLGTLLNRVNHCNRLPPWAFGTTDLMRNLAARGLL